MKQYVTINKRSKKAQKEYYAKQRGTWGELNPVTRSIPSGKTYNRNKDKQERRRIGREFNDGFEADFLRYIEEIQMFCKKCRYTCKKMWIIIRKRNESLQKK